MKVQCARALSIGLKVLACVVMLIGLRGHETFSLVMCVAGLVILAASLVIDFVFHRCPHCGRFLDRNYWGEYCQHCGRSLTREA